MQYFLNYTSISQPFDTENLISVDTRIDCGPIEFEFIDQFGKPIDDKLFFVAYDELD